MKILRFKTQSFLLKIIVSALIIIGIYYSDNSLKFITPVSAKGCSCCDGSGETGPGRTCPCGDADCTWCSCSGCSTFWGYCNGCDPSPTCGGCTPAACPAGQTTNINATGTSTPNAACVGTKPSCAGTDGCDNCTVYGSQCYVPEPNKKPNIPSYVGIKIGSILTNLDPSGAVTLIPQPIAGDTLDMYLPAYVPNPNPSDAGIIKYRLLANNTGINSQWAAGDKSCFGGTTTAVEDNCSGWPRRFTATAYYGDLNTYGGLKTYPLATSASYVQSGMKGSIYGYNYTFDKCVTQDLANLGAGIKQSDGRGGNYLVNTVPTHISTTHLNGTNNSYSTCSTNTATGQIVNNSTTFESRFTDVNGADDIKAVFIGLSINPAAAYLAPNTVNIAFKNGSTNTNPSSDGFSFMIFNDYASGSGTWASPKVMGASYESGAWYINLWGGTSTIIKDASGRDMVQISNISVAKSGNDLYVKYTLTFYIDSTGNRGILNDGDYQFLAYATDRFSFFPTPNPLPAGWVSDSKPFSGGKMRLPLMWSKTGFTWKIDLTKPVLSKMNVTRTSASTSNVDWNFTDSFSGINIVVGEAYKTKVFFKETPISDLTAPNGAANYLLLSGTPNSLIPYSGGNYLWYLVSAAGTLSSSRIENVNIGANEGGDIAFNAGAYDYACNYGTGTPPHLSFGEPWTVTKGGNVYSQGGSKINIVAMATHTFLTANPNDWVSPYEYYKDEVDVTTELFSSGNTIMNPLQSRSLTKSFTLTNYTEENNKPWFAELVTRSTLIGNMQASDTVVVNLGASQSFTDTSICGTDKTKRCVINVEVNAIIQSGFVCDRKVLFVVNNNLIVNPDVTRSGDAGNGCVFLVNHNVSITAGTKKAAPAACADPNSSACYPMYDKLEGLIISDGKIVIERSDETAIVRDGLKINGSLLAFGTSGDSIEINRSLQLIANAQYPVMIVYYDPIYRELARNFFGADMESFKQEVGFKPD